MEQLGTLTITIWCIGMQGMAMINTRKTIVTKQGITHTEAEAIVAEHRRLASRDNSTEYNYLWQQEKVEM